MDLAPRPIPGGVIEGFYGPPWTDDERCTLLDWMARFGLTVYLHCPKDDPHHRAAWREPASAGDAERLADLIGACRRRGIDFIWAVGPGLDIRHASAADLDAITGRFAELARLGCRRFAILFDDIQDALDPQDAARFGTLAAAHVHVANRAWAWIEANVQCGTLMVCPTPYCGRMAAAGLGGPDYLSALGSALAPPIDILWTGAEIISPTITPESLAAVTALLRREPVIWDNFFADDYDGNRFFAGPYSGRPRALRSAVRGVLLNPNNELPLNFVPLHTFSQWLHGDGPWHPRGAFLDAVRDWLASFRLLDAAPGHAPRAPVTIDELGLLADCFYGPFEHGDGAARLIAGARGLIEMAPATWGSTHQQALDAARTLKSLGYRLADLADRPLLHALFPRLWPLREECTLLLHHADNRVRAARGEAPRPDDDHLPGTFRAGFLAELQRIVPVPWETRQGDRATFVIRPALPGDESAAFGVCLETGDDGNDGTPFYLDDPEALARVFVGPYFAFAPDLAWVVEDESGVCGYCLSAADSADFFHRYEREWRPGLTARFPEPKGDPATWTRAQQIHHLYHHPDYLVPGPPGHYPAHVHIDLLPRAQGRGIGKRMMTIALDALRRRGVPGVHLGVGTANTRAQAFYRKLGFAELCRVGGADGCTFMGLRLDPSPASTAEPAPR